MTEEVKKDESIVEESIDQGVEESKDQKAEEPVDQGKDVKIPAKFKDLVKSIDSMSVLDLHELVKLLEEKFGVKAAAVATSGASSEKDVAEEKTEFDVELTSVGDSKIGVIKAVKAVLGLGLKEAKELVDGAPTTLKAKVKTQEAEEIKKSIEEAGGSVDLK